VAFTLMAEHLDRHGASVGLEFFEGRERLETWLTAPLPGSSAVTDDEILRDALGLRRAS
jgi:hypothetical protein